ncbi:MAG TPA: YoaK family protein [Methylocystis sp.]|nr:YoaK family protein [Methylocystis sp.]
MTDVESSTERLERVDVGLALLSFASGSMDALAFFNLGEVFPSAMTGNTALLGLTLGQGHLMAASRPFTAFAAFLVGGAVASAGVELWLREHPTSAAAWRLLALEAFFLAVFALAWRSIDGPIEGFALYALIVAASSAMGIQSVAAHLVGRRGITTVVFTSTLTSIVSIATRALLRPPHSLPLVTARQIGMFLIYGVGAGVCGFFAAQQASIAVVPFLAVVAAAAVLWTAAGRRGSETT